MKIVIFGLTVSSSWGNGHATLWRALITALTGRGHEVVFFEKDVPYYAGNRDLWELPPRGALHIYPELSAIVGEARQQLAAADLAMTTSYCPDGMAAAQLILESRATIKAFYDLDTPVTLDRLRGGEPVGYLPASGLRDFDLVLSYTGGRVLTELQDRLGARVVAPLYGSADPETHHPVAPRDEFRGDLSYLGTYASDRQATLEALFLEPARRLPRSRFVIGGAQYPAEFPWSPNIFFVRHLPPLLHPAFFCSSRATLNVTRRAMADYGYCPSGRLFEAALCGVPVLSDTWEGLETFFKPGQELLTVRSSQDVVDALQLTDAELARIAEAGRARVLAEHTAEARAEELERICAGLSSQGAAVSGVREELACGG